MTPDALDDLRAVLHAPDRRSWRRHLRRTKAAPDEPISVLDGIAPVDDAESPAPPDRPSWRPALLVMGVATAVLGVTALRPAPAAPPPPDAAPVLAPAAPSTSAPTSTSTTAAVRLWPAEPIEVAGREVRSAGHRWEVGAEGDVVVVGDWDCDRIPTPAVLRPATGRLAVFDRWADADTEEPARDVTVVAGATAVRADTACGRAVVTTAAGSPEFVDTRPGVRR
jgi:hypothetical protein